MRDRVRLRPDSSVSAVSTGQFRRTRGPSPHVLMAGTASGALRWGGSATRPGWSSSRALAGEVGCHASRQATCHADTDPAEAPIEEYRPVGGTRHPHLHDDPGVEAGLGCVGEVLPERTSTNAKPAEALGPRTVVEVPATSHVHGVRTRCSMQGGPEAEWVTAVRGADAVHGTEDRQLMARWSKHRFRRGCEGKRWDRVGRGCRGPGEADQQRSSNDAENAAVLKHQGGRARQATRSCG